MGLRHLTEVSKPQFHASDIKITSRNSSIADAYLPRGSDLAQALLLMAEKGSLRVQVSGRDPTPREMEAFISDGVILRAPPAPPVTVERLMERAKEVGHTEIYVAFRHRDSSKIGPDRLEDVIDTAPTLDEACTKAIHLAGYRDEEEIKALGLDQFDGATVMELCDRLQQITGDRFEVSPYETPAEPEEA